MGELERAIAEHRNLKAQSADIDPVKLYNVLQAIRLEHERDYQKVELTSAEKGRGQFCFRKSDSIKYSVSNGFTRNHLMQSSFKIAMIEEKINASMHKTATAPIARITLSGSVDRR